MTHDTTTQDADTDFDDPEAGMTTAEYAVGTLAAVAFAAVLYAGVTSDAVRNGILDLLTRALHTSF